MMSKDKVINAEKLMSVKRAFGFPDDFLVNLVPRYQNLIRLVGNLGEGKSFLELVSRNEEFTKSVIEKLPRGFYLKEMREWIRDRLELPYISPYSNASGLSQASLKMAKRTIRVLHEMLSMTVMKRMAVPVMGNFCEEFRFSNVFGNVFTRHSGVFYVSLKGGIKTAMLGEAHDNGVLVDKDPLFEIKDKFVELMDEGHWDWQERMKMRREQIQKDLESVARRNKEIS